MYHGEIPATTISIEETKANHWHYPDFSAIKKDEVIENDIGYDDEFRIGFGKELLLEDIYVWYGRFRSLSKKPVLVNSSGSHVQMNFSLQNSTVYLNETQSRPFVRFKPHQHNLLLLPKKNMLVQWQPKEETEVFAINITTDFFFKTLPEEHPLYRHFQNGISEILPAFLSQRNLPVTPKMISTLFEILHCTYSGYHKSLFVKAKVIELLALQFDQYEQLPLPDFDSALKQEDIEKMHLARKVLLENIETPLSLKDLAHQIGTNEFNLKKYFKEVFGTTVFGYLHDFRMERSKVLLCEEETKISEVAQQMGYKHATHFTAAFKKHFGYLPNKIRILLIHLLQFAEYLIECGMEMIESGVVTEVV
ncbi:AraC family transcriptional regulator [Dyadobacter psychrotolerans]|uniref:AraC family transcriptional regulator n=2 Tax=Dyadobacter psychrotolerans TaxID=2541721 RepID=A0A4R5DIK8_9BACT|nr:AraC family transcriptional regulator [Dyadobacter psychrotolerans]